MFTPEAIGPLAAVGYRISTQRRRGRGASSAVRGTETLVSPSGLESEDHENSESLTGIRYRRNPQSGRVAESP